MLKKISNDVYLDETEISILAKYNIAVNSVHSYDEILLLIDHQINEEDYMDDELEDLDYVSNNIMERKYYTQINK